MKNQRIGTRLKGHCERLHSGCHRAFLWNRPHFLHATRAAWLHLFKARLLVSWLGCWLRHVYSARPKEDQDDKQTRGVLSFAAASAPYKCLGPKLTSSIGGYGCKVLPTQSCCRRLLLSSSVMSLQVCNSASGSANCPRQAVSSDAWFLPEPSLMYLLKRNGIFQDCVRMFLWKDSRLTCIVLDAFNLTIRHV